ncbi:MAG: hypothetical protein ACREXV_02210 [Polaromonas sp.]
MKKDMCRVLVMDAHRPSMRQMACCCDTAAALPLARYRLFSGFHFTGHCIELQHARQVKSHAKHGFGGFLTTPPDTSSYQRGVA